MRREEAAGLRVVQTSTPKYIDTVGGFMLREEKVATLGSGSGRGHFECQAHA